MSDLPSMNLDFSKSATVWKFLHDKSFVRGLMGPVGSGKSYGCAAEIMLKAVEKLHKALSILNPTKTPKPPTRRVIIPILTPNKPLATTHTKKATFLLVHPCAKQERLACHVATHE